MTFNRNENYFNISVNDIFDELSEENKRLNNELMFANNCLNVFNKFKELLNKIVLKFETIIDSEDKQELNRLEVELSSLDKTNGQIIESNVIIDCQENEEQINDEITVGQNKSNKQNTKNVNKKSKNIKQKRKKISKDMDSDYEVSDGSDYEMDLINDSLKELNPKKPKTKTTFVCTYVGCVRQFKKQIRLNHHIQRIHTLVKPFKCSECDKSFISQYYLNKHQEIHLGLTFECKICNKSYNTQTFLNTHQKTVHSINNKYFFCDFCDFKNKSQSYLKQHINYHHLVKERSVKCDYEDCNKLFKDIKSMKAHKRAFHKTERVMCDWPGCGQVYKFQHYCDQHKLTHLNLRQFVCDFEGCGKAFFKKKTLLQHKEYHDKKSVCLWPECGQRFNDKWTLQTHMNKHLDLKPYKCTFDGCPKEYHNGHSLRFHLKTVHKNQ